MTHGVGEAGIGYHVVVHADGHHSPDPARIAKRDVVVEGVIRAAAAAPAIRNRHAGNAFPTKAPGPGDDVVEDFVPGDDAPGLVSDGEPFAGVIDDVLEDSGVRWGGIQLHAAPVTIVPEPVVVDLDVVAVREIDQVVVCLALTDVVDLVVADDRVVGIAPESHRDSVPS